MPDSPNYPDILGAISSVQRLSLDVADVAFGIDPTQVVAGRPSDAILIIQNNADCEIDAQVKLIIPDKDLKGARGRFSSKADKRIVVGLLPAETGYVSLPLLANPQTASGEGYTLGIEVEIKHAARQFARVRSEAGGSALTLEELPAAAQEQIAHLRDLQFSTTTTGRPTRTGATLTTTFSVAPPGISRLEEPNKAGWRSLWTLHDNLDESTLAERARTLTAIALPQLTRNHVFFALVRANQERCERAGLRLWAGEAVLLSKLMTLVLETGQPVSVPGQAAAPYPRWFLQLCRLLVRRPDLATSGELLATDLLYTDLIYDCVANAFAMVKSATAEDMGTPEEMNEYADALVKTLNGEGESLDFTHFYLPLGLGGLLAHQKVMMSKEKPLDTLELAVNARIHRNNERNDNNQFVFDLLDSLLDRALAQNDTSLQRYLDPIERLRYPGPHDN